MTDMISLRTELGQPRSSMMDMADIVRLIDVHEAESRKRKAA